MFRLLPQLRIGLRLYFRNKMALLYGYLFPTIFLVAFAVLYRHEAVPLVRHMGELLTVTVLGGACFGLPTAMVSERERGVWRRFRLAPVSTVHLVASTVLLRYFLLITAALLQIALAMGIGMPLPDHLFDLCLAFTFVSFAFLGLGLVIAMLADNVPAVQALGQSIFLPMLIIGGVAVRLESLPVWAQHVSAFFPGRYAVEAIQVSVDGIGLGAARFSLLALLIIGCAGCLAGAKLFRWDAEQRFVDRSGKQWVGVALAAWLAVGIMAESTNQVFDRPTDERQAASPMASGMLNGADTVATAIGRQDADTTVVQIAPETTSESANSQAPEGDAAEPQAADSGRENAASITSAEVEAANAEDPPLQWEEVTLQDIERDLRFERLPEDTGVVAPVATRADRIAPGPAEQLQCVRSNLGFWGPGQVTDPVQRARNFLYVAAVPDMFQYAELERWVPLAVFDHLRFVIPEDDLVKVLYWIATHPEEGDLSASNQLPAVCLDMGGPSDVETLRERTVLYALKLLGRLTGRIVPQ